MLGVCCKQQVLLHFLQDVAKLMELIAICVCLRMWRLRCMMMLAIKLAMMALPEARTK